MIVGPTFFSSPALAEDESAGLWDSLTQTGTWALSEGDKRANVTAWGGIASVLGVGGRSSGKRYFEIELISVDNFGTSVRHDFGLTRHAAVPNGTSGVEEGGGYRRGGAIFIELTNVGTVSQAFAGDVIGVAANLDTGALWFALNGVWTQGDPGAGTSPEGYTVAGHTYRPFASAESPVTTDVRLRALNADFVYPVPAGFSSWATP